jgi:hypothetical protein
MRVDGWWVVGCLLLGAACSRSSDTIELKPAFSDQTVVGELTASWRPDGESRVAAGDGGTEQRVAFRIDAHNRLSEPIYLRLHDVGLIAPGASPAAGAPFECTLRPGTTAAIVQGTAWIASGLVADIRGVRVDAFTVPLSERGRAFYREFLLRQRPGDAEAIDAEIAVYAAAPRCQSR